MNETSKHCLINGKASNPAKSGGLFRISLTQFKCQSLVLNRILRTDLICSSGESLEASSVLEGFHLFAEF